MTVADYVDAYLRGEGRGDSARDRELQQFAINHADEIEAEFVRRRVRRAEWNSGAFAVVFVAGTALAAVVAIFRVAIPGLMNSRSDAGLWGAVLLGLGTIAGIAGAARLIVNMIRTLMEGSE